MSPSLERTNSLDSSYAVVHNLGMTRRLSKGGEAPRLILRVGPKTLAALKELAAKDRRSLSEFVRLALEDLVASKRKRK